LVIISGRIDEVAAGEALDGGAKAFLLKASSPELLRHAVGLALSGEDYILCPRPSSHRLLSGTAVTANRPPPQLSVRQREIMQLLGDGKSNKEIARRFGVSEGTVKVHLRTIYKKLQVANRTQAAMIAAGLKTGPESSQN
jgi:DNA-binding NarL/FixJ family response regulator